jgi:hypothetical protein
MIEPQPITFYPLNGDERKAKKEALKQKHHLFSLGIFSIIYKRNAQFFVVPELKYRKTEDVKL